MTAEKVCVSLTKMLNLVEVTNLNQSLIDNMMQKTAFPSGLMRLSNVVTIANTSSGDEDQWTKFVFAKIPFGENKLVYYTSIATIGPLIKVNSTDSMDFASQVSKTCSEIE